MKLLKHYGANGAHSKFWPIAGLMCWLRKQPNTCDGQFPENVKFDMTLSVYIQTLEFLLLNRFFSDFFICVIYKNTLIYKIWKFMCIALCIFLHLKGTLF